MGSGQSTQTMFKESKETDKCDKDVTVAVEVEAPDATAIVTSKVQKSSIERGKNSSDNSSCLGSCMYASQRSVVSEVEQLPLRQLPQADHKQLKYQEIKQQQQQPRRSSIQKEVIEERNQSEQCEQGLTVAQLKASQNEGLGRVGRRSASTVRSSYESKESAAQNMYRAIQRSVSQTSGRSSLAMEKVPLQSYRPSTDIFMEFARKSLCPNNHAEDGGYSKLPVNPQALQLEQALLQLPDVLSAAYKKLAILPKDTPVPIGLLTLLWACGADNTSATTAAMLEQRGLLKSAILENGTIWILVPWEILSLLKSLMQTDQQAFQSFHTQLIDGYRFRYGNDLSLIPDDGYIVKNITTHLKEANNFDSFKHLLTNLKWLETKTHYYGVVSIVEDFRLYMQSRPEADIKLLLQAFQMAESCCQQFPHIQMLRQQLIGRLMVISQMPELEDFRAWYESQIQVINSHSIPGMVQHLMPKTPTLGQAGGLVRMTLRGHAKGITALDLSSDGLKVITGSDDNTAKVWDLQIGDCIQSLVYHSGAVKCVKSIPNSTLVVTGGEDGVVVAWDIESGQQQQNPKHVLKGHVDGIRAIYVDCSGSYVVTASADTTCRLWNVHLGTCLLVCKGHVSAIWDVTMVDTRIISVSEDFTGRVWDLSSGQCTAILQGHNGWVVSVAGLPSHNQCVTASHDCTARLWDVLTGECLRVLEGHSGRINKVAVSNDQSRVVTISDDYTGLLWDLRMEEDAGVGGLVVAELEGHGGWVSDAVFSGDNQCIVTASGDGMAAVWDAESGEHKTLLQGHSNEVNCVAVTHRGRFVVTGSQDGTARVWDVKAADVQVVQSHQCKVLTLNISYRHQVVISTSEDGGIYWWSLTDGSNLRRFIGHRAAIHWASICLDDDPPQPSPESDSNTVPPTQSEVLVTASGDRRVCVWSVETGDLLRTSELEGGSRLKWFAASKVGAKGVAVLFDSSVWLVCLKEVQYVRQLQTFGEEGTEVHKSGVNAVYVDREGKLALTVAKDYTGRLWNLQHERTPSCILTGHTDGLPSGDFSADGLLAATCSYDKTARLWDVVDANVPSQVSSLTMELNHVVSVVKLSPNRQRAITITVDNLGWLWDIQRGSCIACLRGHQDEILGAQFSEDSQLVGTFSKDCTVHIWSAADGCLSAFYMADSEITMISFINRDEQPTSGVVLGDANGLVHFLDIPSK